MPAKTSLTLTVATDLLREVEALAARRGVSVRRLIADQLEELVRRDRDYDHARRRAVLRLDEGLDLDWEPASSREDLHER
jgi:hypothetical protein